MTPCLYATFSLPEKTQTYYLNKYYVSDIHMYLENRNRVEGGFKARWGRPCINVAEDQLMSLLCFQFKIADIATMLQVSPSTISRIICEFGLSDAQEYSIEAIACEFAVLHPNSGQKSFSRFSAIGISNTTKMCLKCIKNCRPQSCTKSD